MAKKRTRKFELVDICLDNLLLEMSQAGPPPRERPVGDPLYCAEQDIRRAVDKWKECMR